MKQRRILINVPQTSKDEDFILNDEGDDDAERLHNITSIKVGTNVDIFVIFMHRISCMFKLFNFRK